MSEYEHVNLFLEHVAVINSTMANYMTLLFAMIAASYLAAHRIDRLMMGIALLIYSIFALSLCNQLYRGFGDLMGLGAKIHELGQMPGSDLGWSALVSANVPADSLFPEVIGITFLCAYIGSIIFFFRARKANRADNIGPIESD